MRQDFLRRSIFKYYPENNRFYGYLTKDIDTGIKILREVMVGGFRPSVARAYDEDDARQHFYHFHKGKCVLIFMAEGQKSIADATGAARIAFAITLMRPLLAGIQRERPQNRVSPRSQKIKLKKIAKKCKILPPCA